MKCRKPSNQPQPGRLYGNLNRGDAKMYMLLWASQLVLLWERSFTFLWMRLNILTSVKACLPPSSGPKAPVLPSDLPSHIPHFTPPSAPLWTLCLFLLSPSDQSHLPASHWTLFPFTPTPHSGGLAPVAKSFCPSYSLPLLSFFCTHTHTHTTHAEFNLIEYPPCLFWH